MEHKEQMEHKVKQGFKEMMVHLEVLHLIIPFLLIQQEEMTQVKV